MYHHDEKPHNNRATTNFIFKCYNKVTKTSITVKSKMYLTKGAVTLDIIKLICAILSNVPLLQCLCSYMYMVYS